MNADQSCRKCFSTMAQAHPRKSYHNGEMWCHPLLIPVQSLTMTICLASPSTVSPVWAGMTRHYYQLSYNYSRFTLIPLGNGAYYVLWYDCSHYKKYFWHLMLHLLRTLYSPNLNRCHIVSWRAPVLVAIAMVERGIDAITAVTLIRSKRLVKKYFALQPWSHQIVSYNFCAAFNSGIWWHEIKLSILNKIIPL